MADSLENFLTKQANGYGLDINQIIDVHRDFVLLKKVCLGVYAEKKLDFDDSLYNCLDKTRQATKLFERTMNKII